jgi:hypothetical protein
MTIYALRGNSLLKLQFLGLGFAFAGVGFLRSEFSQG